MKVWELIAELSKRPAGENVYIARSESHAYMHVNYASAQQSGELIIYGDGSEDEGEDESEE